MAEIPRKRFITKVLRCHKPSGLCRGESSRRQLECPNWSIFPLKVPVKVLVRADFCELDPVFREKDICNEKGAANGSEFINIDTGQIVDFRPAYRR